MMSYSRLPAIQDARSFISLDPLYLDTETTGLDNTDEVIEIAVIDDQANVLFNSLVKPRGRNKPAAQRVNKITDEELDHAPTWDKVWPQAEAVLMNRKVGIYNVAFDLPKIKYSNKLAWLPWRLFEGNFFDIMLLYTSFSRTNRNQSLIQACRNHGISLPNAHRAVADCMLARALLHHMAESAS